MISSPASISRRRANPSGAIARTVPTPSTWPCTMWPPSRSDSRMASSRLTPAPARASARELRRRVSFITSVANAVGWTSVAVRHTPLTEIESPSASSPANEEETIRRTPSPERSTSSIRPRSAISPVNISRLPLPLPDARRDQQIVADALALQVLGADGVGNLLRALALQRIAGGSPSEDERGQEQPDLVDLPGVEERARQ